MRIYDGKTYRDMTPGELTKAEAARKKFELEEKARSLSAEEVNRLFITQNINALLVDDNTALRMLEFYPAWEPGAPYVAGYKVTHNGKLWRVLQAHTSQAGWEPENAASLWEQICRSYSGTEDDPIPYSGNMRLEMGKHYIENDVIYLCSRDTVNPVYHALVDLVGQYVQIKEELSK